MDLAFKEAAKARGKTLPNPAVGAILVLRGKVVGKGSTRPAGREHAEVVALERAGRRAKGSTLYVTLEPCCHYGKTPPCTMALIQAGVVKVFIAVRDSFPKVNGGGIKALEDAGIKVSIGLLKDRAEQFYDSFFFFIKHGRPRILLKVAQSLDGCINARPSTETIITGRETRQWVHRLRGEVDAVLVGGNTFRVDDPELTPRLARGPSPQAVVLSGRGVLPPHHKLLGSKRKNKTVILSIKPRKLPPWVDLEVLKPERKNGFLGAAQILNVLKEKGYHSVLVEGGTQIWSLFLKSGLWDVLYIVTAPKVLPGGVKWNLNGDKDWGNSLNFGKFAFLGKDVLLKVERGKLQNKQH